MDQQGRTRQHKASNHLHSLPLLGTGDKGPLGLLKLEGYKQGTGDCSPAPPLHGPLLPFLLTV